MPSAPRLRIQGGDGGPSPRHPRRCLAQLSSRDGLLNLEGGLCAAPPGHPGGKGAGRDRCGGGGSAAASVRAEDP